MRQTYPDGKELAAKITEFEKLEARFQALRQQLSDSIEQLSDFAALEARIDNKVEQRLSTLDTAILSSTKNKRGLDHLLMRFDEVVDTSVDQQLYHNTVEIIP